MHGKSMRVVGIDRRNAKQQTIRNLPGQAQPNFCDAPIQLVADDLITHRQPISHRLVALPKGRTQAANINAPKRGRECAVLDRAKREALCRIA